MATGLTISSVTGVGSIGATVNMAGAGPGGGGSIQLQLAVRKDFEWVVAPIFSIANAAAYVLAGLNQATSYFLRGRYLFADGTNDDWTPVAGFRTTLAASPVTTPAAVMVTPAIIVFPEDVLAWTAGNEVAGYPAKNVSRDAPVAWRSINAGGNHWITLQHAGGPIDTIAILNTNLPEAATVTVRIGADAAAAAAAAATVGPVAFRASANLGGRRGYHGLLQLGAAVSAPFIRIEISGATPGGLMHVEHIVFGLNRKSKNHALDMTETPIHLGSMTRTRSGGPDRQLGYKMRRAEFDLAWLTEAQHETLYWDIFQRLEEPVFVVPNSKQNFALHDRILYGDLRGGKVVSPSSPHRTRSFSIESLI